MAINRPKLAKCQPKPTSEQIITKQQQDIEQLRLDLTELQTRYIDLENAYLTEHRQPNKSNKTLTTIAILCGIALLVVLILFFKSQGGLPDFSSLFVH